MGSEMCIRDRYYGKGRMDCCCIKDHIGNSPEHACINGDHESSITVEDTAILRKAFAVSVFNTYFLMGDLRRAYEEHSGSVRGFPSTDVYIVRTVLYSRQSNYKEIRRW